MRLWKSCKVAVLFCLIVLPNSVAANANQGQTSQGCGVDKNRPPNRIFANSDGKHGWHEYQRIEEVPVLELDAGVAALMWYGSDEKVLISMQEPGEDFGAYSDYCFDKTGRLLQIRFELRTAWGWGYREEIQNTQGKLTKRKSEFFSTSSEKTIPKPEQANDVPEARKPTLYLRMSQLPFSKLLSK